MADTHDFLALDWVKGEIEETLKQAQQALEAFVENPEDQTRLRFCLTYLHQVYGTLQMVEFYGAALLAEEMEHLTQAMINGKVARMADAQETLMRGMLQLPAYLDRIKASRRDLPVVLMPLLNDLRAARGEKLLSEGALFKPDMAKAAGSGEVAQAVAADPNLAELLRKVRQMFQLGLLGFIRGENLPTNVGHMGKVTAKLEKISGDAAISPLWRVSGAVVEGLGNQSIEGNTAVKLLLGQVDRQIKVLVDQGAPAFAHKPAEDLFKNLLFYVARSTAQSPLISDVRKTYKLDEALPSEDAIDAERAALSGPDRQTMASVAKAISEELSRVKEALDIFMRGGEHSKVADLAPHLPTLKQVSDTIAMLGLGQQRKLILEQHEVLSKIVEAGRLENPGELMEMAGALLYVEATLSSQTDRPGSAIPATPQDALTQDEIAKARQAVITECRAGLELTKEKIVEYIASQWDRTHIQELPDVLTAVRGGLKIIALDRAAVVLQRSVDFIRGELLADNAQPDWKRMDTLADAISSVEYFLERIVDDPQSGDHILDIAEKSVADLGYAVPAVASPVPEAPAVEVPVVQEPAAEVPVEDVPLADIPVADVPVVEVAAVEVDDVEVDEIPLLPADDFAGDMSVGEPSTFADDEEIVMPVFDDEELVVAALDDEPLPADEDLSDLVDALPRVDVVDAEHLEADSPAAAPAIDADFSEELDDAPTLDVPMTAAAERKQTFVDEEVPLVDADALALSELMDDAGEETVVDLDDVGLDASVVEDLPDVSLVDERDHGLHDGLLDAELEAVKIAAGGHMIAEDEVADAVPEVSAPPPPAPAPVVAAGQEEEAEEAAVDEEIVEIFVEEIGEVMSHLDEYFPQWAANQQDEAALKEFRRGFHTLKGSGRMVGAKYVGELAWSVENMLNRVIDKTVEPTPVMIELIRTVKGIAPEMVEAFAKRQKPPYVVESLMDCANAFARGEKPAAVPPLQRRGEAPPVSVAPVEEEITLELVEAVDAVEVVDFAEPVDVADVPVVAEVVEVSEMIDAPPLADLAEPDLVEPELIEVAELSLEDEGFADLLPVETEAAPLAIVDELPAAGVEDMTALEDMSPEELALDLDTVSAEEIEVARREGVDLVENQVTDATAAEDAFPEPALPVVEVTPEEAAPAAASADYDPVLLEVFSSESEQHLATVEAWLAGLDTDIAHHPISDELLRAMHTLKGSARMAGIMPVSEIAGPTEKFCKDLRNNGELADTDVVALVREAATLIRSRVRKLLPDPYAPIPGAQAYLEMLEAIQAAKQAERNAQTDEVPAICAVQPRPGLINDLLAEGLDHVLDGGDFAATWSQQGVVAADLAAMREELRRLASAAERGGITPMAAVAQRLRRVYNGIHDGRVMLASQVLGAVQQGHEAIIAMMDCMAAHQSIWPALEAEAALDAVASDLPPIDAPDAGSDVPAVVDLHDDAFNVDELFSADNISAAEAEVLELTGTVDPVDTRVDAPDIAETSLDVPAEAVAGWSVDVPGDVPEAVEVSLPEEDPVAAPVVAESPDDELEVFDETTLALAAEAEGREPAAAPIATPPVTPAPPPPVAAVAQAEYADEIPDRDPELVEIFLEEADEIVESSGASLETWLEQVDNLIEVQKLQRDLHTLKGGARMAEIPELGDLAHELENLYEGLSQGSLSAQPALFSLLHRCHDRIADMVQEIRATGRCRKGNDLIALITAYIKDPQGYTDAPAVAAAVVEPVAVANIVDEPAGVVAPLAELPVAVPAPLAPMPVAISAPEPVIEEALPAVDPDILEIFIEEAVDLTAELDEALTAWQGEPGNMAHADQLKRVLHTLKGGARLAGLKRLGDISHDFETRVIELGPRAPDADFFASVMAFHDEIGGQVERVRAGGAAAAAAANAEALAKAHAAAAAVEPAPVASAPSRALPPEAAAVPAAPVAAQPPAEAPRRRKEDQEDERRAPAQTAARQAQPQEMVKVPSDLLEKLVNLAGETSINRSRVEQQVTDFRYTIAEMGSTISRLADQLRRLNAEADEQVKANWEAGKAEGKYSGDFDPLEMDQYSGLHQLTKQLFESASDLLDIRDTLVNKSRDTETLLLQQSRVNTELQEGLMRSRMVPFSRLIPRLRRIVRQVAGELKKNIEIDFINPEGEMDRTLLERIVAPLEHMLRNACDHGVEDPQTRMNAGKPAQGRIRLALSREGGEVVLRISDDGKGINVVAVRKKAIERGLMDADSQLPDHEVMQFILEAGFSTAEKVTQISGRGVGMDVVSSEIKQMGGALMIQSEVGKGSTFEVRLPFTVSVNRALMVRVGEDQFAIPLVQIEGIVRVSPYELETYYQPDAPPFDYAGAHYRLNYLGGFVHAGATPNLGGVTMPLPVLLVRGAEHTVAIQVDQLIGSREVVVKAVGPQLSTVAGISGATILGDGRVVIILDLLSLIRAAHLQHEMQIAQQRRIEVQQAEVRGVKVAPLVRETPLIMVTDDSVTVRKVTGRFLERQGFEVITAKDGVDAVGQLADVKPDLMLLDIEMPRMDGFEVASHCRHDSRLKDLPIIMITSRTGEKHRERAMEIGVNAYLGKPFQENELLAKIQELLAERRAQAAG